MEKHDAIRLDGMCLSVQVGLDGIEYYMRSNVSEVEYSKFIGSIREAKAALSNLSTAMYVAHPDIRTKELNWDPVDAPASAPRRMDKPAAIRIDGRIWSAAASMNGIARYLKDNASAAEFSAHVPLIGAAMAALFDISNALYAAYPDIEPKELVPEAIGTEDPHVD